MAGSPRHLTLTANQVTTVTLNDNYGRVEVVNRDGNFEVFFTTDGTAPGIAANGSHILPAAIGSVEVADETDGNSVVKLISTGAAAVSVRGL